MSSLGVEPISSLFQAYVKSMSVYVDFINNNNNKI